MLRYETLPEGDVQNCTNVFLYSTVVIGCVSASWLNSGNITRGMKVKLSVRFIGSFWSFIRRRTDVWTGNCYIEWRIYIIYTCQSCELLDLNFWLRNWINLPTLCLIWQTRFLKTDGNSFQDVIKPFLQKSILSHGVLWGLYLVLIYYNSTCRLSDWESQFPVLRNSGQKDQSAREWPNQSFRPSYLLEPACDK